MTTASNALAYNNTTDADFRAWGSAVSAMLATCGLVQTANTGQINWTTVAKPTGATTYMGYEIWRFNDSLQSTAPVFIKVEYGSGGTATVPGMAITVGASTNGAGTISGAKTAQLPGSATGSSASSSTGNCYASGDGSYLTLMLFPGYGPNNSSESTMACCIDRTRNADGTANGEGVLVIATAGRTSSPNATYHCVNFSGTIQGASIYNPPAPIPIDTVTSWVTGADVGLVPILPFTPKIHSPALGALLHRSADIVRGTDISVSMYGTTHTFKALGTWAGNCGYDPNVGTQANVCLALRYD